MSAIAEVMLDKGYEISGSDLSESAVVKHLKAKVLQFIKVMML